MNRGKIGFRLIALGAGLLISLSVLAGPGRVSFPGQQDGPVSANPAYGPELYQVRPQNSSDYAETWYHEMQFDDRTMITVSASINNKEASVTTLVCTAGQPALGDITVVKRDQVVIGAQGFDLQIGPNRLRLVDNRHYKLSLGQDRVRGSFEFELMAPGWGFGQGKISWPDHQTSSIHLLPIPWAKVQAKLQVDGAAKNLTGGGQLNQDVLTVPLLKWPPAWRSIWIYDADFALNSVDYTAHADLGGSLVQRLVYATPDKVAFTSTAYDLTWTEMQKAADAPFFYPKKFHLSAVAGGMTIKGEFTMGDLILKKDLFSSLPRWQQEIAARLMPNGWSYDYWCPYQLEISGPGGTKKAGGQAVCRWVALEEKR